MADTMKIFLCGDVMTGRGIDQILPHPCAPRIHEGYVRDARDYVRLAEAVSGPIARPVDFAYVWGDALAEWERESPDVRLINLETAVTVSEEFWPDKGINYRMHPANIEVLKVAGIDCCVLANNHILDWSYAGLRETLAVLRRTGLHLAGAGENAAQAAAPAVVPTRTGRLLVFAFGMASSGVPAIWAAGQKRPGVNWLADLSSAALEGIGAQVRAVKEPGDLVVASVHWGGNWDYRISPAQRHFAHRLIDAAQIDLVHGHSSHHVKGLEVYQGKLILYGCGDFLNDYEGIGGYEAFHGDLSLMYFAHLDAQTGRLLHLRMTPTRVRRFQVRRADAADSLRLLRVLNREGQALGAQAKFRGGGQLVLAERRLAQGDRMKSR